MINFVLVRVPAFVIYLADLKATPVANRASPHPMQDFERDLLEFRQAGFAKLLRLVPLYGTQPRSGGRLRLAEGHPEVRAFICIISRLAFLETAGVAKWQTHRT